MKKDTEVFYCPKNLLFFKGGGDGIMGASATKKFGKLKSFRYLSYFLSKGQKAVGGEV